MEEKKLFCKHCGSEVDLETSKCTNCGKTTVTKKYVTDNFIKLPIALTWFFGNGLLSIAIHIFMWAAIFTLISGFIRNKNEFKELQDHVYATYTEEECLIYDFIDEDTVRVYYFHEKPVKPQIPYNKIYVCEADYDFHKNFSLPFNYFVSFYDGFSINKYKYCIASSKAKLSIQYADYIDLRSFKQLDTSDMSSEDIIQLDIYTNGLVVNNSALLETDYVLPDNIQATKEYIDDIYDDL